MLKVRLSYVAIIGLIGISAPVAQSATVGVFGTYGNNYAASLSALGHSVTYFAGASFTSTNLAGLDAVLMIRSTAGNDALKSFVNQGGTLITEWSSAGFGGSLLGATVTSNFVSAHFDDTIVFSSTGAASGLSSGLGASYHAAGGTEFFQDFANVGHGSILATRGSTGATAIIGGKVGSGYVFVNGFDWADTTNASTAQLLSNEINAANTPVPEADSSVLALSGLGVLSMLIRRKKTTSRQIIAQR